MKLYFINGLMFLLLFVFLKSCATPMGPTGGEQDRTGPHVISTSPQTGSTNFSGRQIEFTFDKFIDRNNFRRNVTVEPDLGIPFSFDFKRRTAVVEFERDLPENTTVIIKVGTDVTDTNRNKMERPFELALSTGDVIDSAAITARILDAETGRGESGNRVFLYRMPADLLQRAMYVAETDTSGSAQFGYISEGEYRAFWVNDVNRNRVWDPPRELAQPFMTETFFVSDGDSVHLGTLYKSVPDTTRPRIEGVGLLSEVRLRLRLSEELVWDQDSFFTLLDTLGNEITAAYPLFEDEQNSQILFAQSEEALGEDTFFTLKPHGFTDSAGNPLIVDFEPFPGSSVADTTILRTVSHNAGSGLFPDEPLEITYSAFINEQAVKDSLIVVEGDRIITDWEFTEIERNILRISPGDSWQAGIRYQFRVWNPWEQEHELVDPEIWQRNQLGSILFVLENHDSQIPTYLTLTDSDLSIRLDTTFTDSIQIDNLPPLSYKAILFEDIDGDGKWDRGEVEPWRSPEPYDIRRNIPVREGFTSEVMVRYARWDEDDADRGNGAGDEESENDPDEEENSSEEETESGES
ncbi:MAG: hypothetical protein EA360_08515 [Balneolaceae bacterium]|nr:MAG: hypothetical protein EA360_08515 [Balneolaceae bacterium]